MAKDTCGSPPDFTVHHLGSVRVRKLRVWQQRRLEIAILCWDELVESALFAESYADVADDTGHDALTVQAVLGHRGITLREGVDPELLERLIPCTPPCARLRRLVTAAEKHTAAIPPPVSPTSRWNADENLYRCAHCKKRHVKGGRPCLDGIDLGGWQPPPDDGPPPNPSRP